MVVFKMEMIDYNIKMIAAILKKIVISETKNNVRKELGGVGRETLDFIAEVRKRGAWILSYGGYAAFLGRLTAMVPDFDGYS